MPNNDNQSDDDEVGEYGVAWIDDVEDDACEHLFSGNDPKSKVEDGGKVYAVDATHPSTLSPASSGKEENEASSGKGDEDDSSGSSSGDEDEDEDDDDENEDGGNKEEGLKVEHISGIDEFEELKAGASRLATFSADLRTRFTDNNSIANEKEEGEGDEDIEGNGEEYTFQRSLWPGDTTEEESEDGDGDSTTREAEGGDAFAADEHSKAILTKQDNKEGRRGEKRLSTELSTTWMEFDDDKWDSLKHEDGSEHQHLQQESASTKKPDPGSHSEATTTAPSDNNKKMQNGKFSLEVGLANVSKNSQATSTRPRDGPEKDEIISFWGEGSDEEESANDPLAMALKSKPSSYQSSCNNDSSVFKSPRSQLSSLNNSSKSSSLGLSQQQQQLSGGWIQKGLGNALGKIGAHLPFTKSTEDDEEDNLEEDNVVEAAEMPFPNYGNTEAAAAVASTAKKVLGVPDVGTSMQDVSAMSDDSAFSARPDACPAGHRRSFEMAGAFETNDGTENKKETNSIENNGGNNDNLRGREALYDDHLTNAMADRMNEQKGKGIKFAEEVKESKMIDALPLYDLVIDMPHPVVDASSDEPVFIGSQSGTEEDVEIQNDIQDSMPDISCLTFPEYDSSVFQEIDDEGAFAAAHRFQRNHLEKTGFSHYTFSIKVQSGSLVYAHVRRYLPAHGAVPFRYDIGRRLGRALVIFTRYPGGDDFFAAVLRTLEAMESQHTTIFGIGIQSIRPQKWFLQNLSHRHQRLCGHYASTFDDRRGAPHVITLQGLEFADCMEHYASVDATHFFLPNNLLHKPLIPDMKTSDNCSIMPVLRCLGVANGLRLLSALLSERRIVLVSVSPTRLDRSVRAAMTILAQGMLKWQHMCIPVLPADLWSCLTSPAPYIIGVIAPMAYRLELTDDLGDVFVVNLDESTVNAIGNENLPNLVPDMCKNMSDAMLYKRRIPMPENVATEKDMASMSLLNSTSDFLAQDLVEIVKSDKQTMNGTSVVAKHMAKKASKAVKSTLQYFWGGGEKNEDGDYEAPEVKKSKREKRMEADAVFIEGCRNEAAEEAAKLAFVSFFLRLLGNTEGYMYNAEDSSFRFNKEKFLKERQGRGDGQGSPMWAILLNFSETQMVREFVKVREERIRQEQPIPADAPLFWKCIDFLEIKNFDFGIINVRSVARMMLQKSLVQQMLPSNIRRLTMALTSKRKFEGHTNDAIADLAELSRESGSALYDVMSVIWLRSRDCKGLQWVHGYQAMKVLKEVLVHGPLAAIAHATDGIQRIRTLAYRKSQGSELIQAEALEILNLLSDRSRLFLRRRVAGESRRKHIDPDATPLVRDTRLNLESAFKDMHAAMNPSARPPEKRQRRTSLSARRSSLSARLPHRLSITKHIMALEPMDDSMSDFPNILKSEKLASRHHEFLGNSFAGSIPGGMAHARRYVREVARKTAEEEKNRTREAHQRRDSNAIGVELLKKQFMLLKVAIYLCPIFYIFGNHEHFLTIVMFVWLSQQLQVFKAPIDTGGY